MRTKPRALLSTGSIGFFLLLAACGSGGAQLVGIPDDGGVGGQGGQTGAGGGSGTGQITITTPDASITMVDDDAAASSDAPGIGLCGDGVLDPMESCDDSNAMPGDGCSGVCTIEPGYACAMPGKACVYTITMTCGNGQIEGTEDCDDNNLVAGDGCAATCDVEPGWACTATGCKPLVVARCGDGAVSAGEECDDGANVVGDGCDAVCKREAGWTCPTPGQACVKFEYCGDGTVQASRNEQCDDGNTIPGDGCSGVCQNEPGYACSDGGSAMHENLGVRQRQGRSRRGVRRRQHRWFRWLLGGLHHRRAGLHLPESGRPSGGPCALAPQNTCGDAVLGPSEQCDDGNTMATDGCSDTCGVEPGYTCPTPGMACTLIAFCGDGAVSLDLSEECDDHNTTRRRRLQRALQARAQLCLPDSGASLRLHRRLWRRHHQRRRAVRRPQHRADDGCNATCQLEAGLVLPGGGRATAPPSRAATASSPATSSATTAIAMSERRLQPTCKLEPGFACVDRQRHQRLPRHRLRRRDVSRASSSATTATDPYDGCSPTCTIEPKCAGGQCTPVCGDGLKFPQEACDDGNTSRATAAARPARWRPGSTAPWSP